MHTNSLNPNCDTSVRHHLSLEKLYWFPFTTFICICWFCYLLQLLTIYTILYHTATTVVFILPYLSGPVRDCSQQNWVETRVSVRLMGDEQCTEAEICSLELCDFCLLCPVVLLAGGGTSSLALLARWNGRWTRIWASLLSGLKLLLFQKYMTCHRNILSIKI